jgi:NAD(P)-dependent dehydrogenase (short-subunit alcohol dehydrogenase family)
VGFDVTGMVAAVTGGASGIGLALAERLAAEGADLFVEAVRANRTYVFTHPEAIGRVRARTDALLEAFSAVGAPSPERAR